MGIANTLMGNSPVIYGRNLVSGIALEEMYEGSRAFGWLGVMTADTALEAVSIRATDTSAGPK